MVDGVDLKLICRERIKTEKVDSVTLRRREERESGRQKAAVFAEEALLAIVSTMRTTKDDGLRVKSAIYIINRAWGTPKAVVEEEEARRNQSIIELLAEMSSTLNGQALPSGAPVPQITQTDPGSIEGLLVDDTDG